MAGRKGLHTLKSWNYNGYEIQFRRRRDGKRQVRSWIIVNGRIVGDALPFQRPSDKYVYGAIAQYKREVENGETANIQ